MKRCLRGIGAGTADQGRNGCRQAGSDEESKGHLAPGLTWQPRAPPRSDMRHLSPAQASSHSTCPAEAFAARRKVGFLHCRKCPPPARCASCIPGRHCHLVSRAARVVKLPSGRAAFSCKRPSAVAACLTPLVVSFLSTWAAALSAGLLQQPLLPFPPPPPPAS